MLRWRELDTSASCDDFDNPASLALGILKKMEMVRIIELHFQSLGFRKREKKMKGVGRELPEVIDDDVDELLAREESGFWA